MIDSIKAELKDAMISKDKNRIIALRNFLAKLKQDELQQNVAQDDAKIRQNSAKIPSEIGQSGGQECSENDPGSKSVAEPQTAGP